MSEKNWIVIKFGGNSVSNLSCWQTIAHITKKHLSQYRVLIVCSALSGITDKLEKIIIAATQNQHQSLLEEIIQNYRELSEELDVGFSHIQTEIEQLKKLIVGISLLQEVSPSVHAKVLAFGEILLTKLGAAFLQKQFNATWCDARQVLKSVDQPNVNEKIQYLAAQCDFRPEKSVIDFFNAQPSACVITQGFIASNANNETVILGRGGSDTSAAYFAAKLKAARCEIWTDVPGIYTANPRDIPEAKLLKSLDYDEAQEIASMGAKVLHPRCLPPLKVNQIPLYVACTHNPDHPGTEISVDGRHADTLIKCISTKYEITLIQIDSVNMWQQAGFLADIFACFKQHGLSIDLVSTSESSVTVSLDLKINVLDNYKLDNLLADLNTFAKATAIGPCAAVSIVGQNIRSILHKLGNAFKVFEEQKIYLISQASNDLNLTFVVDENQALRLARELHALLFEPYTPTPDIEDTKTSEKAHWWETHKDALLAIAQSQSPRYVYHENTVVECINSLKTLKSIHQLFYAIKANYYPDLLRRIEESGFGFECVSLGEIEHVLNLFPNIDRKRILFTPNFAPKNEYETAFKLNVIVTVDNLYPLQHWPELFRQQEIILRFDPGKGYGHHHFVCTGGHESKFGIPVSASDTVKELLAKIHCRAIGLHTHVGSGIFDYKTWRDNAVFLFNLAEKFPDCKILNLGGGLGVSEKPGQHELDLAALDKELIAIKKSKPHLQLWLEPGRFLVSEAGVLLAKVTQLKTKGETFYIGIDAGMNSLIRPALYGAYHHIVNLSRLDEPANTRAQIVGPICESGDTLGFSRLIPQTTQEGDILLIANAGAYGHVMSSNYNLRRPAPEISLFQKIPVM